MTMTKHERMLAAATGALEAKDDEGADLQSALAGDPEGEEEGDETDEDEELPEDAERPVVQTAALPTVVAPAPAPKPPAKRKPAPSNGEQKAPPGSRKITKRFFNINAVDLWLPENGGPAVAVKVYKLVNGIPKALPDTYPMRALERCRDVEDFITKAITPQVGAGDFEVQCIADDGRVSSRVPVSILGATQAPSHNDKLVENLVNENKEMKEKLFQAAAPRPALPTALPVAAPDPIDTYRKLKELEAQKSDGGGMMMLMMLQQQVAASQQAAQSQIAEIQRAAEADRAARREEMKNFMDAVQGALAGDKPDPMQTAVTLVQTLKPTQPERDPVASTVSMLKDLIVAVRPVEEKKESFVDQMRTLKELGVIGEKKNDDVLEMLTKLDAIQKVAARISGGSPLDGVAKILDKAGDMLAKMNGVPEIKLNQPAAPEPETQLTEDFPDDVKAAIAEMAKASDDEKRINTTIGCLKVCGTKPGGEEVITGVLTAATQGRRADVFAFLREFLDDIVKAELLVPEQADRIFKSFEQHQDAVFAALGAPPRAAMPAPKPAPAPKPVAPAPAPAPAPVMAAVPVATGPACARKGCEHAQSHHTGTGCVFEGCRCLGFISAVNAAPAEPEAMLPIPEAPLPMVEPEPTASA